jgi:hypothetical protein
MSFEDYISSSLRCACPQMLSTGIQVQYGGTIPTTRKNEDAIQNHP